MEGRRGRKRRKDPVVEVDSTANITRIYPDREPKLAEAAEPVEARDGEVPAKEASSTVRWLLLVGLVAAVLLLGGGSVYLVRTWLDPLASANDLIPIPQNVAPVGGPPHYLFSIYGPKDLGLLKPLAVTEGPNGEIYIADSGHGLVQVFDYNGNYRRNLGKPAGDVPAPGEMRYPIGVTADQDGNVYVSDSVGGHISVFSPRGPFLRYFGEAGGAKSFGVPGVITYHDNRIYLADLAKHQIVVLGMDGYVETVIGKGQGSAVGYLQYPNGVWMDDGGLVYVSDSNNNRVQVFTLAGEVKRVLNSTSAQTVAMPRGLAVDREGLLHVVNTFKNDVQVYDSYGEFKFSYGEAGDGQGQFSLPNGLWIAGNRIYITDRENNRVQVWEH